MAVAIAYRSANLLFGSGKAAREGSRNFDSFTPVCKALYENSAFPDDATQKFFVAPSIVLKV